MSTELTLKEGYSAMLIYLEELQKRTLSDDLAEFLGAMELMSDGTPRDAAAWSDWLNAVNQVTKDRTDKSS